MFKLLLITLLVLFNITSHAKSRLAIIDPGHGGEDDGAVYNGKKEAHIALKISLELKKLFDQNPNWQAKLTRDTNRAVALTQRVKHKGTPNLFVSIHANASPAPQANGVEFYLQNQLSTDQHSQFLASIENQSAIKNALTRSKNDVENIIKDLQRSERLLQSYELSWHLLKNWNSSNIKKRSRRIRQAPFYVLSQNDTPSVLVEVGFISNPHEAQKLSSNKHQKLIAKDLYKGLLKFAESIDKPRSPALDWRYANR